MRNLAEIDRDLATQRTNLELARGEDMRAVVRRRLDRLLEERLAVRTADREPEAS